MLKKSKISNIRILSEEWHMARLGKFTSSDAHKLMGSGYNSYVRLKVGEELTGKSAKDEIDTDATRWGSFHEADAIQKFGKYFGLEFIFVQQLITEPGSRFGSTPDGLIATRYSPDETEIEADPVEVKCPPTYDNYLLLWECDTPKQLKEAKKEYYWQVLDQIDNCESLKGHFVAYHPEFKAGNFRHIEFDVMKPVEIKGKKTFPLYDDLKALRNQKAQAVIDFELKRDRLLASGRI
jgi:hypothetical protein